MTVSARAIERAIALVIWLLVALHVTGLLTELPNYRTLFASARSSITHTWLDRADLVFIDPPYEIIADVAPGLFSRLAEILAAKPDAVVVFDVEAVFIFPWAVRLERLGTFALVEMVIFVVILALALVSARAAF